MHILFAFAILILTGSCGAGAFEVISPASLRSREEFGDKGFPSLMTLRKAAFYFGITDPRATPPLSSEAQERPAVLFGARTAPAAGTDPGARTVASAAPGSPEALFPSRRMGSGQRSSADAGVVVDDCGYSPTPSEAAAMSGAVVFMIARGFNSPTRGCALQLKETIATALGAAALVVVDVTERDFDIPSLGPGTDFGTGSMPVWKLQVESAEAIVDHLLAGTPVTLKMYQDGLSPSLLDDFVAFFRDSGGVNPEGGLGWTLPSVALAPLLTPFLSDEGVASLIPSGGARLFCTVGFIATCSPDGETLRSLTIVGFGFSAPLSPIIGRFTDLESFQAGLADLRIPLPQELGTLTKLRSFTVASNPALAGSAAPDLSALTKVWIFRLVDNGLVGPRPAIEAYAEARVVDISNNMFTGTLPTTAAPWSTAVIFKAAQNQLTGAIPAAVGAGATALTTLDLSRNRLEGAIPETLGAVPRLAVLDLKDNALGGTFPATVASSATIRELRVSGNTFASPFPSLAGMASLVAFECARCGLAGTVLSSLPPSIMTVDLSRNLFDQLQPPGAWWGLQALRSVNLEGNRIASEYVLIAASFPRSTSPFTGIESLDLRNNRIGSKSTPPYVYLDIVHYPALREVLLSGNLLEGEFIFVTIPPAVPNLRVIDIEDNPGLVGAIQGNLAAIPLTRFSFRGTGIVQNVYANGVYAAPAGGAPRPRSEVSLADVPEMRRLALGALTRAAASDLVSASIPFFASGASLWGLTSTALINDTVPVETEADLDALHAIVSTAISPSMVVDPTRRVLVEDENMLCPVLMGANRDDTNRMQVDADPSYHNYALCVCLANFYRDETNRCRPCPDNIRCPGDEAQLERTVATGFFPVPSRDQPEEAIPCHKSVLSESPCNPDSLAEFSCRVGYAGRLCSECTEGYFSRNGLCVQCSSIGVVFVAAGFAIIFGLFGTFLFRMWRVARATTAGATTAGEDAARAEAGGAQKSAGPLRGVGGGADAHSAPVDAPVRPLTMVSILLFYAQTLSLSMDGFDLPASLGVLKELYDLTNLSITSLGARCVVGSLDFSDAYRLAWVLPIAIVAIMWLATVVFALLPSHRAARSRIVRVCSAMTLVVVTLVYFPMSTRVLSVTRCVEEPVTGDHFLARDPSIPCERLTAVEKAIPIAVYPAGCTLAILVLALIIKRRLRGGSSLEEAVPRFAEFFFLAFRDDHWPMAVFFFLRRLFVAMMVALVPADNAVRYAAVAIVILSSAAVVTSLQPYRTIQANRLDAFTLNMSAVIYVCSFIAANQEFTTRSFLVVVVFALHIIAISGFIAFMYQWGKTILRAKRRTPVVAYKESDLASDGSDGD